MAKALDDDWLLNGICDAIREHRQKCDISQETLAMRSGLHRTYISDLERGARNISVRTLQRLAAALDTTPSQLINQSEEKRLKQRTK